MQHQGNKLNWEAYFQKISILNIKEPPTRVVLRLYSKAPTYIQKTARK